MIKMIKTIVNAIIYITIIAFLFCLFTLLVQEMIAYQLGTSSEIPLAIQGVRIILSIPVLGDLIQFITSLL